ncbi:DUF2169 domain-containing protein [Hyalangium sp.]|uniref:DUF2169 family type VI secretion system accessory protein n=1 Tax=Hyalangium sp. TaxID=2028555 RepID=UPI002D4F75D8|nr:DUF2169 domain-containing protein [Hyalangium sp.]HYI02168.1 DUF2169 domain-containing protein [Hyalangium sp.]
MDLVNRTPFAVVPLVFLHEGLETLLLVVKGTFTIERQLTRVADEQDPIVLADEYGNEPHNSSLLHASDVTLLKPATDVLLRGYAYSTPRSRTEALIAFRIGTLKKGVRVFGDRVWERVLRMNRQSEPKPFVKMELTYERAFGGTDTSNPEHVERCEENPVGRGFRGRESRLPVDGAPLPNLEEPGKLLESPDQRPRPACFGPIPPSWKPRPLYAGTYDEAWKRDVFPFLPRDFDPRFYQCAPPDQILPGYIQGGEPVVIAGASAQGQIQCALPTMRPEVTIRMGERTEQPLLQCDTILLDADRPAVTLVWRAQLSVQGLVPDVHRIEVSARD